MNTEHTAQQSVDLGPAQANARVLRLMMVLRVVIVTALLGSALYVQIFFGPTSDSLYFIIGLTYLLTVFYAVLAIPFCSSRAFAFAQLLIDVVLVSLLVLATGAVDSAFIILYYLLVVAGSVTLGRAYSFSLATVAGAMFATLAIAANGGAFDLGIFYPYSTPALNSLLYVVGLHIFALAVFAALSGYLAGMLQRTAARLIQRTADLDRLRVISESIVRAIPSGIVTTDLDGRISFVNPAASDLLQLPVTEVLGSSVGDFLLYQDSGSEAPTENEVWRREMPLHRGDGALMDIDVTRTLLTGPGGSPAGRLYVIQDLREIRSLQSKLRLKDKLAAAGEMSAAIAHEIRNPLGAISGSAQMIRKAPDLPEDQRYYMDIIVSESQRLNNILKEFLAFARQPVFSPVDIDLLIVARETAALLANSPEVAPGHEIKLATNGLESLVASVDPNMVRQLIYNLATNGVRAMPDGGMLRISVRRDGGDAILEIRDSGVGIPAGKLERLFQPFDSDTPGGVGIGMAIVYRIVQEHGGSIRVRSLPGKGTSVTVALPMSGGNPTGFSVEVESAEP